MSALSYFNEPAPLAWDVSAAIFGADGLAGVLTDISDPSTLYQTSTGGLPSLPGDPVGLVLDGRNEMGPELVPDGTAGWEPVGSSTITVISGVLRVQSTSLNQGARRYIPTEVGKTYLVRWRAVGRFSRVFLGATAVTGSSGGRIFTANAASTEFRLSNSEAPATIDWDNISVREVIGDYINLTQPTAAARPTLARMPKTGRRNLLTWTEDFSNSAWTKTGITTDGGTDVVKVIPDAGATFLPNKSISNKPLPVTNLGLVCEIKSAGLRYGVVGSRHSDLGGFAAQIDFETGEVSLPFSSGLPAGVAANAYVEPLEDGWFRVRTQSNYAPSDYIGNGRLHVTGSTVPMSGTNNREVTGNGVDGVLVRKPSAGEGEPTPYQRVTNAYDVTEEGVPDTYSLVYDLADDNLTTALPQAVNGDILIAGTKGSIIEPVSYAAGSTFTLGPDTYTGGTPGIMRAIGDVVGLVLIDRTLTQTERENLLRYYKGKGAKGLLVPGPELVVNPDFSDGSTGWSLGPTWSIADGKATQIGNSSTLDTLTPDPNPNDGPVGKVLLVVGSVVSVSGGSLVLSASRVLGSGEWTATAPGIRRAIVVKNIAGQGALGLRATTGNSGVVDYFSVKELRPQEDW